MSGGVHFEIEESVAIVTLDNPPLNIFDVEMRDGLIEAFAAVADIDDVSAMVLRAEGKHFSAGADLSEFGQAESIMAGRRIRWDRDPWGPLADSRVPTVVALHGYTVGSGLEMALLCDIRLASKDTQLGLPETKLGMLPSAGGTQSLTAAIGPAPAVALIATAITMDATEAAARGIVHSVTEDVEDVEEAAFALALQWAGLDRRLLAAARRALRASHDLSLIDGLALERDLARGLRPTTLR